MGYDKPDLGFVAHFQAPGSVVAYYQQVGRAGRGVDHAEVVLLRGAEDRRIQDFFIEQAFPSRDLVARVLARLDEVGEAGATTRELMGAVNLGAGRLEALLKILDVEGPVFRDGPRWRRDPRAPWVYDEDRYRQVTALRRAEQAAMAAFGADGRCLMRALQEELDDPDPEDCGRCSVCAGPRHADPPDPALVRAAQLHLRSQPIVIEPKRMAPDAAGAMRKIPEGVRVEEGLALARSGDAGWDPLVRAGLRAGRFEDELVEAAAELVRGARWPLAWVTAVPSRRDGDPPGDFARRLAGALGLPYHPAVSRVADGPPQAEMRNAAQQVANVRGRFSVGDPLPAGPCLLVDDLRQSGWTLSMVGGQLRQKGAPAVRPLALATTFA
jgi:ATP-dependent DNA helicase RecQ